ncbi:MAG: restriction endonuclease subunit S [Pyramidobacter sp.]|nr:restriction endonuclease subunit S [Pyramidobacter sp.]
MTRAKNKKDLTPEEKRAQALVPPEEQPYEVPGNWRWVRLQNVTSHLKRGKAPKYIEHSDILVFAQKCNQKDGTIAMDKAQFLNPEQLQKLAECELLKDKDIVINSTGTGTLGRVGLYRSMYALPFEKVLPDSHVTVIRTIDCSSAEYLFYFLKSHQEYLEQQGVGTTNQKELRPESIATILYPLPPLPEQRRIVERIERLFARLDEAACKAQSVLASCEARKTAILHKAFTGELTVAWRKRHNIQLDNWKTTTLQSVCLLKITDGTHQTPTYCDEINGIPFISAKDVTSGEICWNNVKYITPELHKELHKRFAPQVNDVLLAKNGTTGVASIVDVDKVFDIYVTLAVLRPNTEVIIPRYLLNVVNSPLCKKQFDEHLRGIGVPNLHLRDIKEVQIFLPTLAEQEVIVYIIDNFLNKNAQIQNAALSVLTRIAAIKQSILARAFCGELGTNDPAEPAAELPV